MKKRKMLQHSLWLTALIATAAFCRAAFDIAKPLLILLFAVFVLIPQVIAIIIQFREVRECYARMLDSCGEKERDEHPFKMPLCAKFIFVYTNTYALLKSRGINPNRAGPAFCI